MAKAESRYSTLYFKDPAVKAGLVAEAERRGLKFNALAVHILADSLRHLKKQKVVILSHRARA